MNARSTLQKKIISVCLSIILIFLFISPISTQAYSNEKIPVYRKIKNDGHKIALTFDDGPHPRYTPQILDILDEYNIKATFFVVGVNAKYYPEALELIAQRGHEIANHTYTHPHVSSIDTEKLKREVEDCESEILSLVDERTKLFRPPEGMIDESILGALNKLDYKVVLWNIDTRDWAHTPAEKISEHVISNISDGDIILMHDYIGKNSPTPQALRLFLPVLIERGYKFVTISELIASQKTAATNATVFIFFILLFRMLHPHLPQALILQPRDRSYTSELPGKRRKYR